ncbi:MAG TPA: FUSC family protein [Hyphomicrobiales bacterium]|nr:FUSC family protein [Hyphomicrobiales bacterium]
MTSTLATIVPRLGRAWPDALRMLAAALAAYGLSAALGLPDGYWAVLTALIVTRPSAGGLVRAGADRLAATVAGAALATARAAIRPWGVPEPALIAVALAPLSLLVAWDERFRAAPMAAIIVLSGGAALGSPVAIALARVAEVMLGAAVGILVSTVVLPTHRTRRRRDDAAAILADLARLLDLVLGGDEERARLLQEAIRRRLRALAIAGMGEPSRQRRAAEATLVPLLSRLLSDVAILGRAWRSLDPEERHARDAAARDLAAAVGTATAAIAAQAPPAWRRSFEEAAERLGAAGASGVVLPALPFLLGNLRTDLLALGRAFAADTASATSAA